MSERYSRVFSLEENLYVNDSPIIIVAGAVLKDNKTNKIIGQLKFKNIDEKNIKALTVQLKTFDTTGNPLEENFEHTYLDLNAQRDEEFGQKERI